MAVVAELCLSQIVILLRTIKRGVQCLLLLNVPMGAQFVGAVGREMALRFERGLQAMHQLIERVGQGLKFLRQVLCGYRFEV